MSKPQTAGPENRGLEITARRDSFWRAGLEFGAAPRQVRLSDLTPAEADALRAEPQLVVAEIDMPVADAQPPAMKGKGK